MIYVTAIVAELVFVYLITAMVRPDMVLGIRAALSVTNDAHHAPQRL